MLRCAPFRLFVHDIAVVQQVVRAPCTAATASELLLFQNPGTIFALDRRTKKVAVCTCPLGPPHATGCIQRVAHWAVHGKAAFASADRNSTEVHAEASLNWHNRALQLEATDTCAPRPTTRSVSAAGATALPATGKRMCMPSRRCLRHGVSCGRLLPVKVERAQQRRRDATYDLSRACCCNNTACAPPCNSCTGVAEPCTASSQPIWQCANPAFHVAHSDC